MPVSRFNMILAVAAVAAAMWSVVAPLWSVTYPAMTDLPYHTTHASIIRHYFNPEYAFFEQYEIQSPFRSPYVTYQFLTAGLLFLFPIHTAEKISVLVMLGTIPLGLAVLCSALRKSPILALAGLPLIWCKLTHYGFINFMGAIGFALIGLGIAIKLMQRPSRILQAALLVVTALVFFSHIFRFPSYIGTIVFAMCLLYPVARRLKAVLPALTLGAALFGIFLIFKNPELSLDVSLQWNWDRMSEVYSYAFNSFTDPGELSAVMFWAYACAFVLTINSLGMLFQRRGIGSGARSIYWKYASVVLPFSISAVFAFLFLTVPVFIGMWWGAGTREIIPCLIFLSAALPDLPQKKLLRTIAVSLLIVANIHFASVMRANEVRHGRDLSGFEKVSQYIPARPKLFFDSNWMGDSVKTVWPYNYIPSYIQAEKGGWANWDAGQYFVAPIVYKEDRLMSDHFNLQYAVDSDFYEWFIFRQPGRPVWPEDIESRLELVAQEGNWWLFKRRRVSP